MVNEGHIALTHATYLYILKGTLILTTNTSANILSLLVHVSWNL